MRGWVKIQDVEKQQNDRSIIVLEGRTNNGATFPFQTQFNHQNGNRRHFGHKREIVFTTKTKTKVKFSKNHLVDNNSTEYKI